MDDEFRIWLHELNPLSLFASAVSLACGIIFIIRRVCTVFKASHIPLAEDLVLLLAGPLIATLISILSVTETYPVVRIPSEFTVRAGLRNAEFMSLFGLGNFGACLLSLMLPRKTPESTMSSDLPQLENSDS